MFARRFRWLSALPLFLIIAALAIIALGTLSGAHSPNAHSREQLFDFYQRLKPAPIDSASSFHLIVIDRESLNAIGPWPWPRTILAQLVDAAQAAGAKGVLLAEPVDSPDPLSPEVIGEFWLSGAQDEELGRQLGLLPSTDAMLATALMKGPSAIAVSQLPPVDQFLDDSFERVDIRDLDWLNYHSAAGDFLALPAGRLQNALHDALKKASQLTVSALQPDGDGIVRRLPLLWSLDGVATPALALEAARLAAGSDTKINVIASKTSVSSRGQLPDQISLDDQPPQLARNGILRLYQPKGAVTPSTPAWRILSGAGSNSQLDGAVVIIGSEVNPTSIVKTSRGAFSTAAVHALAAEQILSGVSLSRPVWAGYLEAITVMLFGAAAIMAAQRMNFWGTLGLAALFSVVLLVISFAAFSLQGLLLNPLPPALSLFIGAFSIAGGKSLGVALRDDSLRGSFHDSFPEPVMKRLREGDSATILNGVARPITILACDLRLLDEDLKRLASTPDDVAKIMAAASINLRRTIINSGGAVDQAEGGRLFAYFNVPTETANHIEAACSTALRLIESMDKVNTELESSAHTRGVQVHLAIGIATGECFAGPMGHGRHNRYSAIGPAIDIAAFLRRQSEFYGPAIICDEAVYRDTHHHFAFLELDRLRTNKSERPVSIHALIGNPFIKSSKSYRELDDVHRQLLTSYRSGDWAQARAMLTKAKASPGAKIALFDIYEERIQTMSEQETPPDWDGSHLVKI